MGVRRDTQNRPHANTSLKCPSHYLIKLDQSDLFFRTNCQTANQTIEVKTGLTVLQIEQKNNQAMDMKNSVLLHSLNTSPPIQVRTLWHQSEAT